MYHVWVPSATQRAREAALCRSTASVRFCVARSRCGVLASDPRSQPRSLVSWWPGWRPLLGASWKPLAGMDFPEPRLRRLSPSLTDFGLAIRLWRGFDNQTSRRCCLRAACDGLLFGSADIRFRLASRPSCSLVVSFSFGRPTDRCRVLDEVDVL